MQRYILAFVWIKRKLQSNTLRLQVEEMQSKIDAGRDSEKHRECRAWCETGRGPCYGKSAQEMLPTTGNNELCYNYAL